MTMIAPGFGRQKSTAFLNLPNPARLVVIYGLFGPLVVSRSIFSVPIGVSDLLAVPALLVVLGHPGRALRGPVVTYGVLLWVLFAGSVVADSDPLQVLRLGFTFLAFPLGMSVPGFAARQCLTACFYGGLVATLGTITIFLAGIEIEGAQQRLYVQGQGSINRAGGLLGNSGSVGHLTAAWLVACFTVFRERIVVHPWLRHCGAIAGLLVLILSSSRAGVLHVLIALIVYELARSGIGQRSLGGIQKVKALGFTLGVILVAGVVAQKILGPGFSSAAIQRLIPARIGGDSTFYRSAGRSDSWSELLSSGTLTLTGRGYRGWDATTGRLLLDNSYLTLVEAGGAVALGLLTIFIVSMRRVARDRRVLSPNSALALMSGQAVHAFFGDTIAMWYSMSFGLTLIGLACAFSFPSGGQKSLSP